MKEAMRMHLFRVSPSHSSSSLAAPTVRGSVFLLTGRALGTLGKTEVALR